MRSFPTYERYLDRNRDVCAASGCHLENKRKISEHAKEMERESILRLTSAKKARLILKNPLQSNAMSKVLICVRHSRFAWCNFLLSSASNVNFSMLLINWGFCNENVTVQIRMSENRQTPLPRRRSDDMSRQILKCWLHNIPNSKSNLWIKREQSLRSDEIHIFQVQVISSKPQFRIFSTNHLS